MFFEEGIHNHADARRLARKRLPRMVFDYIDGAAGDEAAARRNRDALDRLILQPRVLNNVEHRDLGVAVFGEEMGLPFGVCPMGMCNLAAPGADLMLARMAADQRIPLGVSTAASTPLERLIEAAAGHAWFQLYFSGDEAASMELIARAEAAGYGTLVLTVDVPEVGRRPRELRRGFKMPFRLGPGQLLDLALHPRWSLSTLRHGRPGLANFGGDHGAFDRTASRAGADWTLVERFRARWRGKFVVKGVLSPEDAVKLKNLGADAVQVSNHGGRQLESAPAAILALREIRSAVGSDFPLFFDSGLRSGEDVVKAYAMGADFVFFGRPLLFAIAGRGVQGLAEFTDALQAEISIALAQLGLCDMTAVTPEVFWRGGEKASG